MRARFQKKQFAERPVLQDWAFAFAYDAKDKLRMR
jgi:hypothetical protein